MPSLEQFIIDEESITALNDVPTILNVGESVKYVLYDYAINEVVHGFVVIKAFGDNGSLVFQYMDDGRVEYAEDMKKADVYLYGSVKWDGCSNWMYPECENRWMLHFCSVEEAKLVAQVMDAAYKIAAIHVSA
jgi:hypothetical protein